MNILRDHLFVLILICSFFVVACKPPQREIAVLHFAADKDAEIWVNGEKAIDVLFGEKYSRPISFSALFPNDISVNNEVQQVSVPVIKPGDYITIQLADRSVTLALFPEGMPHYKVRRRQKNKEGYFLLTPFDPLCWRGAFAYILNTQGELVHYRQNTQKNRCVSDFKKTVLPEGKVRFTLMEQDTDFQSSNKDFWTGHLLVMNEKLQPLKQVRLQATSKHPQLGIENHDSLMLGDDHFILSAYWKTQITLPNGEQANVVATVIQEIKDGKVIFDWVSTDHPEFYEACLKDCSYGKGKTFTDYLHINAVEVDPKDRNLLVSFGKIAAVVKLHRQTGKILWILGGKKDQFGLTPEQQFASQHTLSVLPGGELMIFDNHSTSVSRGIEQFLPQIQFDKKSRVAIFDLDEKNLKIKRYKQIPLRFFARSMGSVYVTDEGNYVVGFGASRERTIQEITPSGKVIFDMTLQPLFGNYRVQKYNHLN